MQLTMQQIEFIQKRVGEIKYGEVRLCLNETSKHIDIIIEERQRFEKDNYKKG